MKNGPNQWGLKEAESPPSPSAKTVVLATIHPAGDQRVLKCAQAVLEAGARLHLIWLGDVTAGPTTPWVQETILPSAGSARERVRLTFSVLRGAMSSGGSILYVHDFYMLPHAWIWKLARQGLVVYDSHEHYPELYAAKFPQFMRRPVRFTIRIMSKMLTSAADGFSLVSQRMTADIGTLDKPIAITPNYPSSVLFQRGFRSLRPESLRRSVHSGSLSRGYGAAELVTAAAELERRGEGVSITAIRRFTSDADRDWFDEMVRRAGSPATLDLVDPMPAREMQEFLQDFGVGISALRSGGQSDQVVPTKLYEYAVCGLYICASDLPAQKDFIESNCDSVIGTCFTDGIELAQVLGSVARAGVDLAEAVNTVSSAAERRYSWDNSCRPPLTSLFADLLKLAR